MKQTFVARIGRPLPVFLGCVLLVKVGTALQLRDHPLLQPDAGLDTTAYVQLARQVLEGNVGLGPGLYYVSPLYIYFVAAVLAVSGSFTVLRIAQVALGTSAVWCTFVMARRWFGARAAWLAAVISALTGLFTFYESVILQASLDPFLTAGALSALAIGLTGAARRWFFLAGLMFGIQTLNRPNIMLAAAGLAVVLLALRRFSHAALLLAGLLAAMTPVAVRNLLVADQWSFVASHGGLNFHIGNGPGATGFYRPLPGISPTIGGQEKDARRVAEQAAGRPMTDAEVSRYFFGLGWSWMREHPGDALQLFAKKFAYAFGGEHVALPHSYPFYAYESGSVLRFLAVGPWLLIPLGLVGLVVGAPSPRRLNYFVWTAFVPLYAAAVAVFFVAERYRLPLLVPLCAGAGAAVDGMLRALAEKRTRDLAGGAFAFAALLMVVNWPRGLYDGRWEEGVRLAQRLVILERYDEAEAWAARVEAREPRPGATSYGIGAQLLSSNQPARALVHLRKAFVADPGQPSVEYALGRALLDAGHAKDGVPHLRRGFESGMAVPNGGLDLVLALQATGDVPGAVAALRRVTPGEREDVEAWLRLGRLAAQLRAPEVGEVFFREAVRMKPNQPSARQQLGLNLLVLERFDEAVRELTEAARLDPQNPDTLSHLAYCELKLGRHADARDHALKALALNSADRLARQVADIAQRR